MSTVLKRTLHRRAVNKTVKGINLDSLCSLVHRPQLVLDELERDEGAQVCDDVVFHADDYGHGQEISEQEIFPQVKDDAPGLGKWGSEHGEENNNVIFDTVSVVDSDSAQDGECKVASDSNDCEPCFENEAEKEQYVIDTVL